MAMDGVILGDFSTVKQQTELLGSRPYPCSNDESGDGL
jgi:hypothetical protein